MISSARSTYSHNGLGKVRPFFEILSFCAGQHIYTHMLKIKVASNITKLPQISYTLYLSEGSTRISCPAWLILYWTEPSQCLRWKPGWNMINLRWTRSSPFLLVWHARSTHWKPGQAVKKTITLLYMFMSDMKVRLESIWRAGKLVLSSCWYANKKEQFKPI